MPAMSDRALLELDGVGKRYGRGHWVLRDLNWQLDRSNLIALTAANGAGKATLLRLLAGVSRPSSGRIGPRPARTRYVPDRMAAFGRLSAIGYLTHMGRLQGLDTATARCRAGVLLDRLILQSTHETEIRQLSKGNAQKVSLAQAWLTDPELLLLDEPWSALDERSRGVLNGLITETIDAGGAVVFTDHQDRSGLGGHQQYELSQGQLRLKAGWIADAGTVEVRLAGDPTVAPDWSTLAGVFSVSGQGDVIDIRVSDGGLGGLLIAAIDVGWSIRRVHRGAR